MPQETGQNKRFTYSKNERLKKRSDIQQLFSQNNYLVVYPYKLVYLLGEPGESFSVKTGVSVSKKFFKKAVTRNLLKRRMRECFRLNKHLLYDKLPQDVHLSMMFIYIGKEIETTAFMEKRMQKILTQLHTKGVSFS